MAGRTLQEIVTKLPALTPSELQTLKVTADHLLAGNGSQREVDEEDDELFLFYTQIRSALSEKGVVCRPWFGFKQTKTYTIFKKQFPKVQEYTNQFFGPLTRRRRQQLYGVYSVVLVNCISQNPYVPLNTRTAFQNVGHISEYMATAFPGYAKSGFLPVVVFGLHQ